MRSGRMCSIIAKKCGLYFLDRKQLILQAAVIYYKIDIQKGFMVSLVAQYFLNHRLDLQELEWQIDELAKAGYQGVYAQARAGLLTPYMSDDWWRAIDKIIERCKKNGIEFRIWDEDYYPSGLAGGRVVWDNPGLISRGLEFVIKSVEGKGPFEVDFESEGMLLRTFAVEQFDGGVLAKPLDVTKFCGTRRQRWENKKLRHGNFSPMMYNVANPHWRSSFVDNRFALSWTPEHPGSYLIVAALVCVSNGNRPNILSQQATQRFIEFSHEQYLSRYGNQFGTTIKGVFSDEPSPGWLAYPWIEDFPEQFLSDHGYDLLDNLAHLALDIDQRSAFVRHHYRLTQHRLQYTNFLEKINTWCQRHHIEFTGHLTRTEWLSRGAAAWPNELRCYKPMHIPHADPLCSAYGWPDASSYHSGLKVVSSASHLFKREHAGSDSLAVVGDEASLRDLKAMLDYQMVMGINFFSMHGLYYSLDGLRKEEAPPSLFYQHSQWKHMSVLLEYAKKTCQKLTGGKHLCELAVLYPSTSLGCQIKPNVKWANQIDEKQIHSSIDRLLTNHCDFDFIDEITLQENVDHAGKLTTPESYTAIILLYVRYIDEQTSKALLRYAKAGGRVATVGCRPMAITKRYDLPQISWAEECIEHYDCLDELLGTLPSVSVKGNHANDVFILRRYNDNKILTFAFNRSENNFLGTIEGKSVSIPGCGSVLLEQTASGDVLFNSSPLIASLEHRPSKELSGQWDVKFDVNHLPLNYWHVSNDNQQKLPQDESVFVGPGFDVIQGEPDPAGDKDNKVCYSCRLMLTGEIPDARLVIEESGIMGDWRLYVNGTLIEGWRRSHIYDCKNRIADIGSVLLGNGTPTFNIITIETAGKGRGIKSPLYLYGTFQCEYRYNHLSFPFVKGVKENLTLDHLLPWDACGYPVFSGSARYTKQFAVDEAGDYLLDLGRVETIADVTIDGKQHSVLAWPPYSCQVRNLSKGQHHLQIEVTNAPANRNRAARLISGLLGPVRLYRLS